MTDRARHAPFSRNRSRTAPGYDSPPPSLGIPGTCVLLGLLFFQAADTCTKFLHRNDLNSQGKSVPVRVEGAVPQADPEKGPVAPGK